MPADLIALAAPVVFIAYVVFGMTGFGAAMVAVPILAQFMPLSVAVPLVVLFDGLHGAGRRPELAAGVARGTGAAVSVDAAGHLPGRDAAAQCRRALAADRAGLLRADGLRARPEGRAGRQPEPLPTPWALPFGVFGGVFSALFGTGGPIYTIYLSRRIAALDAFRATISVVILASGVVRAGAFAAAGLYTQPAMLKSAALLLPVALAGLYAGSRLRTRVAPARLQRFIFLLLAVAGAGAIYRGWMSPA